MTKQLEALWAEKYRPKTIENYVFHDKNQQLAVLKMIRDRSIPHLLLSGVQGSGKTCLAKILIAELEFQDTDVLIINASDENSVDVIRDKIKTFIMTFAMGDFKIVLLDEADYLTHSGQAVLRAMMVDYSENARFILTCNYDNKISPALKSRCQHFHFKAAPMEDVTNLAKDILESESVNYDVNTLETFVSIGYPDIRKIINLLQQHSIDGTLHAPISEGKVGDWKFELIDLIQSDSWLEARHLVCANVIQEEWENVYRFLYDNLDKAPKFGNNQDKYDEGIVTIAEHLYKHSVCSDSEINAAALLIRLGEI